MLPGTTGGVSRGRGGVCEIRFDLGKVRAMELDGLLPTIFGPGLMRLKVG
jgi:hypothetical protein